MTGAGDWLYDVNNKRASSQIPLLQRQEAGSRKRTYFSSTRSGLSWNCMTRQPSLALETPSMVMHLMSVGPEVLILAWKEPVLIQDRTK
jgi:hypothetical protein